MPSTKDRKEYFREYQKAYYERNKDEIMKRRRSGSLAAGKVTPRIQPAAAALAEARGLRPEQLLKRESEAGVEWREMPPTTHPLATLLVQRARARATKAKQKFSVRARDVTIPERCPVLGGVLAQEDTGPWNDDAPMLVCKDPAKAFTKENAVVMSRRAVNMLEGFALEELVRGVQWLREVRKG